MRKWRVYQNEATARRIEGQISEDRGYPIVGTCALMGRPQPDKQQTVRWADPIELVDGRWVMPSPNETGVDRDPGWVPVERE